jgi:hypothetical protein
MVQKKNTTLSCKLKLCAIHFFLKSAAGKSCELDACVCVATWMLRPSTQNGFLAWTELLLLSLLAPGSACGGEAGLASTMRDFLYITLRMHAIR